MKRIVRVGIIFALGLYADSTIAMKKEKSWWSRVSEGYQRLQCRISVWLLRRHINSLVKGFSKLNNLSLVLPYGESSEKPKTLDLCIQEKERLTKEKKSFKECYTKNKEIIIKKGNNKNSNFKEEDKNAGFLKTCESLNKVLEKSDNVKKEKGNESVEGCLQKLKLAREENKEKLNIYKERIKDLEELDAIYADLSLPKKEMMRVDKLLGSLEATPPLLEENKKLSTVKLCKEALGVVNKKNETLKNINSQKFVKILGQKEGTYSSEEEYKKGLQAKLNEKTTQCLKKYYELKEKANSSKILIQEEDLLQKEKATTREAYAFYKNCLSRNDELLKKILENDTKARNEHYFGKNEVKKPEILKRYLQKIQQEGHESDQRAISKFTLKKQNPNDETLIEFVKKEECQDKLNKLKEKYEEKIEESKKQSGEESEKINKVIEFLYNFLSPPNVQIFEYNLLNLILLQKRDERLIHFRIVDKNYGNKKYFSEEEQRECPASLEQFQNEMKGLSTFNSATDYLVYFDRSQKRPNQEKEGNKTSETIKYFAKKDNLHKSISTLMNDLYSDCISLLQSRENAGESQEIQKKVQEAQNSEPSVRLNVMKDAIIQCSNKNQYYEEEENKYVEKYSGKNKENFQAITEKALEYFKIENWQKHYSKKETDQLVKSLSPLKKQISIVKFLKTIENNTCINDLIEKIKQVKDLIKVPTESENKEEILQLSSALGIIERQLTKKISLKEGLEFRKKGLALVGLQPLHEMNLPVYNGFDIDHYIRLKIDEKNEYTPVSYDNYTSCQNILKKAQKDFEILKDFQANSEDSYLINEVRNTVINEMENKEFSIVGVLKKDVIQKYLEEGLAQLYDVCKDDKEWIGEWEGIQNSSSIQKIYEKIYKKAKLFEKCNAKNLIINN